MDCGCRKKSTYEALFEHGKQAVNIQMLLSIALRIQGICEQVYPDHSVLRDQTTVLEPSCQPFQWIDRFRQDDKC